MGEIQLIETLSTVKMSGSTFDKAAKNLIDNLTETG